MGATRLASGHFSAASIMHSPIFQPPRGALAKPGMCKQTDAAALLLQHYGVSLWDYTYVGISS